MEQRLVHFISRNAAVCALNSGRTRVLSAAAINLIAIAAWRVPMRAA